MCRQAVTGCQWPKPHKTPSGHPVLDSATKVSNTLKPRIFQTQAKDILDSSQGYSSQIPAEYIPDFTLGRSRFQPRMFKAPVKDIPDKIQRYCRLHPKIFHITVKDIPDFIPAIPILQVHPSCTLTILRPAASPVARLSSAPAPL